jgi:acetolactate synthase I/II/III large subunit
MEDYGNVRALIDVMNASGVEHVFFNPGIDNVPVLETLSGLRARGEPSPRGILCLDEFVAMTAAHGNWMASGRPQAVSVHSELGTLQLGGSLHNAQWGRVPVVFFTETQGPPQRTDWCGDTFDQGKMVRSFVKWDYCLAPGEDVAGVFQEAFRVAATEPCGPVYLNLPREVLWGRGAARKGKAPSAMKSPAVPPPDAAALEKAAEILVKAQNPLIVTGYSGRNLETVAAMVKLAETLAAPVLASDFRVNFPSTHPLAAYVSPTAGRGQSLVSSADVVLAIDYDMHYAAPTGGPAPEAKIIHIDIDTAKRGVPLWGRKPDILVKADSALAVPALTAPIEAKLTPARRRELKERRTRLEAEHNCREVEWHALAESHADAFPITAHWLSRCLDEVIDEDTVIVNQTISPSFIVAHLVHRTKPGTLLSCAGGCIGWAPGAALGVKLAHPEKTVVSLMGDGAFIYGCPEASLWSAVFYQAPFLAVIYDNQGYGAIKGLFRERFDVDNMGADIPAPPDYALIAQACNAYGRRVEDPSDVVEALEEALDEVRRGRPAVLDVRIEPV